MANFFLFFIFFLAIFLVTVGIGWYAWYIYQRRQVVKKIETEGVKSTPLTETGETSSIRTFILRITNALGNMAKPKGKKGEEDISHLRQKFFHAGLGRKQNIVVLFFGAKLACAILLLLILFISRLSFARTVVSVYFAFFLVLVALIGFYLPDLWLRIRIANRQDKILRGFPDALDLMVVCAEAGMGLDAAMTRVGEEIKYTNRPLSEEFQTMSLELRAGKLRREALKNLGVRTGLEDIRSFATILVQTDKFGTSIAQALRVQADAVRTRRHQRVEELAGKLPVKLIFPTILFIFPSLFVILMAPALIQAFRVWSSR